MNNDIIVEPGDVFHAGRHVLACADIEKDNCCELLKIPDKIYMVYSDPPWNPANARMWRTLSQLDGPTGGRKVDWDNFTKRFCQTVLHSHPEHIFIEMGVKNSKGFVETAMQNGFPVFQNEWSVFYNYTHPNKILYFSDNNTFTGNPEGMKNEAMTRHIFEHIAKANEIVFDPCTGLGMTVRMAVQFNMIFYGIELNPQRLKKTLLWLSKYFLIHRNP